MPESFTKPWYLHRLALEPLLPGSSAEKFLRGLDFISPRRQQELAEFLVCQGLAPFWHEGILRNGISDKVSPGLMDLFHRSRLDAAGFYLIQRHCMRQLKERFDEAGIPHLLFKGGHIREFVYDAPALRRAADLDVLVEKSRRKQVVELLKAEGYRLYPDAANVSHEVTLGKRGLYIDLHWDLMRPGRTREPLADAFLRSRRDCGSHWGPAKEAMLFLMLVHPVITKYVNTPHALLVRVLDLFWWLEQVEVDWTQVLDWLDRAGLRTAAWLTLEWAGRFGELVLPDDFHSDIAPGRVRRGYLRYWIDHDLPGKLLRHPLLTQVGFTLPVHDRLSDAWRVVGQVSRARREAQRDMELLTSDKRNRG